MLLNDVTLREGNQMPGREYSVDQKVTAGTALSQLGVQFIQAGFPATGQPDQEAITALSNQVETPISALARAREADIDAAINADADIIDIFLPISDNHLKHVLNMDREKALDMLAESVGHARDRGGTIHITLADAFRTDVEDVRTVFEAFPSVDYITLADTVGARTPSTVRSYLQELRDTINLNRTGVHFHDDLGVATANVLAAYDFGVGKADVSVASLGERAGNAALEEVVVSGVTDYDDPLGVNESQLVPVCRDVLETLGEDVEVRKAILGEEVTKHESGIHTAAMLDEPTIFEAYDPERFGGERRLFFGAGTGYTGARKLLERADVDPTEAQVKEFAELLSDRGSLDTDAAVSLAKSKFKGDN
ncbi:LeuA family protein [Halobacterium sp. KA-6]|uniref:LeuA family protein n=1 Tax=Halobacterium sp. KA-6 TaxID=2896368 RepID=UPI001E45BC07|nr:citramalate synthase [Halobacterium sp. KA-6]MCD2203366.1 citramalate synthase [Halobacterium sp. KA-6]